MNHCIPMTLHEAAEALASGALTSRQLCESLLERTRAVEHKVRAYIHLDEPAILQAADEADQRRKRGQAKGRFDGVPIGVKANMSVNGQPCTCASKILEGYTSLYDATVVARLRQAGFIFFGRCNQDEFAMGSSTEHSAVQQTANPWDLERVPGGSSGGSAAAVAAGEALAALGSDTGGSIRQPAGFCGVVGMKPTYGRVSRYGLVAFASSLDQIGPITKDVRDAAILMDLISGQDPKDSTSLPLQPDACEAALAEADLTGLRIGMPTEYYQGEGLDPEVRTAIEAAAKRYQDLGAELVEISLPHSKYAVATYYIIATAEASTNLARFDGIRYGYRSKEGEAENLLETYRQSRADGFGDEVKRRIILGTYVLSSGYYDAYYLRAQKVRTLIRQDFNKAFEQCDVILGPVTPTPAFKAGEITDPLQMYLADIYTISANLAGICGLSMPCAFTRAGLPVGMQLLGPALGEKTILQAAYAFEKDSPCQGKTPEIS